MRRTIALLHHSQYQNTNDNPRHEARPIYLSHDRMPRAVASQNLIRAKSNFRNHRNNQNPRYRG